MSISKIDKQWGSYKNLLDTDYCKVKEIIINPNEMTSYQYHQKREEIWIITKGKATTIIDDKEMIYERGQIVKVSKMCKHRVMNKHKKELRFIEVQLGTYFGEDDIVRLKDKYGRI